MSKNDYNYYLKAHSFGNDRLNKRMEVAIINIRLYINSPFGIWY